MSESVNQPVELLVSHLSFSVHYGYLIWKDIGTSLDDVTHTNALYEIHLQGGGRLLARMQVLGVHEKTVSVR